MSSLGQSPLVHCFSRMTETSNVYENRTICLRIADELLAHGADINKVCGGRTLLMDFCAITMSLDAAMLEMNLHGIEYLLQNGADPHLKTTTGETSFDLAVRHCASDRVLELLKTIE